MASMETSCSTFVRLLQLLIESSFDSEKEAAETALQQRAASDATWTLRGHSHSQKFLSAPLSPTPPSPRVGRQAFRRHDFLHLEVEPLHLQGGTQTSLPLAFPGRRHPLSAMWQPSGQRSSLPLCSGQGSTTQRGRSCSLSAAVRGGAFSRSSATCHACSLQSKAIKRLQQPGLFPGWRWTVSPNLRGGLGFRRVSL